MEKVIGRGTWLDKLSFEIIQRERTLKRNLSLVRVESGLGASGIPHVGSLSDALRAYGVKLAIEDMGFKSELVAYSDDMDGLRKVPAGLPKELDRYLAMPVSRIPDPFGCHGSYGSHMGGLLREALDVLRVEYRFESGAEVYRRNLLRNQIEAILSRGREVGEKIKEMTGQEKYEEVLPYFPVCANCGRIYTAHAKAYEPSTGTVAYECIGADVAGRKLEGCGHRGEVRVSTGEGKLSWKVEFAARWAALDVRFEAYGKDIADSVRVNDWVSQHVLGFPPPFHVQYEMFLDKSGRKISKSAGNVFTPQTWFRYGSPKSLVLLMYKRIKGARTLSTEDIPKYMDEYDQLEDIYFGKAKVGSKDKAVRLRGLYEYTNFLRPPRAPEQHVPYRLLAEVAFAAPPDDLEGYCVRRLQAYRMVNEPTEALLQRIRLARNWAVEVMGELPKPRLTAVERKAVKDLVDMLSSTTQAEAIQDGIFEIAKSNGLQPGEYFKLLYRVLLGSERGPRLGPYIVDVGVERVASSLKKVLE